MNISNTQGSCLARKIKSSTIPITNKPQHYIDLESQRYNKINSETAIKPVWYVRLVSCNTEIYITRGR